MAFTSCPVLTATPAVCCLQVAESEKLGMQVDMEKRLELLVETTCYAVFAYVAQVGLVRRVMTCSWSTGTAGYGH